MTAPAFRDQLPSCYRHLLPVFFDAPWPSEPHATCDRCTMLPPPGVAPESGRFFRPETKCCTYHPFLPNYAVGGLLGAEETRDSPGRESVKRRLAERDGVVPAGIRASARYLRSYQALGDMGTEIALRCPYYDEPTGGCTVWRFREAACTTWFCKLRYGRDGLAFWSSLRGYLHALERVLARHGLRELGFSDDQVQRAGRLPVTANAAVREDGPEGEAARRALWGEWWGREEELYVACYRQVLALDAAGLARLGGSELEQDRVHVERALEEATGQPLSEEMVGRLVQLELLVPAS